MNSLIPLLASYALNALWQVPAIAAAGWVLSRLFRRLGPGFAQKLWVAVLILAAVLPLGVMVRPYLVGSLVTHESQAGPAPAFAAERAPNPGSNVEVPVRILQIVTALYAAFLALCGFRLVLSAWSAVALVRAARPSPVDPDAGGLWRTVQNRFAVGNTRLLLSADIQGPVTTGFATNALLLPVDFFETHSQEEVLTALGHECAHIERGDFRKNLLYELAGVAVSFHPVTWWIKSQIAQTREMICDQLAADRLLDRSSYALALLQLAGKLAQPAAAVVPAAIGVFDSDILEKRIMNMTEVEPIVSKGFRRGGASIAAVCLLACAGAAVALTQPVTQSAAAPATRGAKKAAAAGAPNLNCTYYGTGRKGYEGLCGRDKDETGVFRCYKKDEPTQSDTQIACEWKVQRYERWQKAQKTK
jgi:beta-lactamase regulating signal transducer with metallopeptidase domain